MGIWYINRLCLIREVGEMIICRGCSQTFNHDDTETTSVKDCPKCGTYFLVPRVDKETGKHVGYVVEEGEK